MAEEAGQINVYRCRVCGGGIVTVNGTRHHVELGGLLLRRKATDEATAANNTRVLITAKYVLKLESALPVTAFTPDERARVTQVLVEMLAEAEVLGLTGGVRSA